MVDIVAFGPHPDDVEIGCAGTLALHTARGHRVAIVDLTRGEMGSNGSPVERWAEAEAAARILGVAERRCLDLPDRGLAGGITAGPLTPAEQLQRCVEALRTLRPRVVLAPWGDDRHPDHVAAHHLLREAVFNAGLGRYETDQEPHRVLRMVFYFINRAAEPSFLVDITGQWPKKIESLFAHASQFRRDGGRVETRLNRDHGLAALVEARDRYFGAQAGTGYAEGFRLADPPVLPGLPDLAARM